MGAHGQKAAVLYDQRRYDLAAEGFRRELAENPNDPWARACLSLSLAMCGRARAALSEASAAVALAPNSAMSHYALSFVQFHLGRPFAALQSIRESLRLDPENPETYAHAAAVHQHLEEWGQMLRASEAGLAFDPRHVACLSLRAQALTRLGRTEEADRAARAALARSPDDATTHATRGWILMHQGDVDAAVPHFRESLRLDPMSEDARRGFVESLKARRLNFFGYRPLLRYLLWSSRHRKEFSLATMGIMYIAGQVSKVTVAAAPQSVWVVAAFGAMMVLLLVASWLAESLFTAVVARVDSAVAQSLLPQQRAAASYAVAIVVVTVAAAAVLAYTRDLRFTGALLFASLVILPVAVTASYPPGRARRRFVWLTSASAVSGGAFFTLAFFASKGDGRMVGMALSGVAYVAGCLLSGTLTSAEEFK